jgi:hypothetical protein
MTARRYLRGRAPATTHAASSKARPVRAVNPLAAAALTGGALFAGYVRHLSLLLLYTTIVLGIQSGKQPCELQYAMRQGSEQTGRDSATLVG